METQPSLNGPAKEQGIILSAVMTDPRVESTMAAGTSQTKSKGTQELWHERLGHVLTGNLQATVAATEGIEIVSNSAKEQTGCLDCVRYKMQRAPFARLTETSHQHPFPLGSIHMDVGQVLQANAKGKKYFLVSVDTHTKYVWATAFSTRDEVQGIITKWMARVHTETSRRINTIITDGAGEFVDKRLEEWVEEQGVFIGRSAPHTPQQNGAAENRVRTLKEGIKVMLEKSGLSYQYWTYALSHLVSSLNCQVHAGQWSTPFEQHYKAKPNLAHLRVFGSMGLYYIPKESRREREGRARWGIYLGMSNKHKASLFCPPQ